MRFGPIFLGFWALVPTRLAAQTDASVGAGAGSVVTSDGAHFGSAVITPGLELLRPTALVTAQGTLARLSDGLWSGQLRSGIWARLGRDRGPMGVALATDVAGSLVSNDDRTASADLLLEIFRGRGDRGFGLAGGASLGMRAGALPVSGPHVRIRAWWQTAARQASLAVEPMAVAGHWFVDADASATAQRGPVTMSLALLGRIDGDQVQATAWAFLSWHPTYRWAFEASGGGFLSDPLMGFPRVTAASFGVRLHLGRAPQVLTAPLLAQRRGDSVVVRVRIPGATSVAVVGEWSGWTPQALLPLKRNHWEIVLALAPGTYRFNLVIDGTQWLVPPGIATLPDELGGSVGLLVVPVEAERP